jgi:hypothetical protein
VVSDGGSNILSAVKDNNYVHVKDVGHRVALAMEHAYKTDVFFKEMVEKISSIKSSEVMRSTAYLLPPKQRTIARFMNLVDQIQDLADIFFGGPAFFMELAETAAKASLFGTLLNSVKSFGPGLPHAMTASLPIPQSVVKQLSKITKGASKSDKLQEIVGTVATNFVARALGFRIVSFNLAYHGIDAVYVAKVGGMDMYVIAESKGGKSKLSKGAAKGDQMYQNWIDESINQLETKNRTANGYADFVQANKAHIPMLAAIVKLDIETNDPHLFFGVHLYPTIGNYDGITKRWGNPFE